MTNVEMHQGGASTSNLVTETRKPSKVKFILGILLFVVLVVAIVFIALYVSEKNDNGSGNGQTVGGNSSQGTGDKSCEDVSCVISAGGTLTVVVLRYHFWQASCFDLAWFVGSSTALIVTDEQIFALIIRYPIRIGET
jgi:hypothetical protein